MTDKGTTKMIMLEDNKRLCSWEQDQLAQAQSALEQMPKIKVRGGKEYTQVSDRVIAFRRYFPGYSLTTELVEVDENVVVAKATIRDILDRERASDYAEEIRTATGVNSTSAVENCTTSAIGRALAAFGLPGGEYASADELIAALSQQDKADTGAKKFRREDAPDNSKDGSGGKAGQQGQGQPGRGKADSVGQADGRSAGDSTNPDADAKAPDVAPDAEFMSLVADCETKDQLNKLMSEWKETISALPENKRTPIQNLCRAKLRKLK